MLWLDSIPCVRSACEPPDNAPLTPEEADIVAEYLSKHRGPAGTRAAAEATAQQRS